MNPRSATSRHLAPAFTLVALALAMAAVLACSSKGSSFIDPADQPSGSGGAPTASATLPGFVTRFQEMISHKKADLDFAGFTPGACPAADLKYMATAFGGGWSFDPSSGTTVNMVPLVSSQFGLPLTGTLDPKGVIDVSGHDSLQTLHLILTLPQTGSGPTIPLTGTATFGLNFTGTPAIGTVTGTCNATYSVAGTLSAQ